MRIYRIDHIGQSAPDLEAQVAKLERLFGFRRTLAWDGGVRLAVPGSWGQYWEVLERPGTRGGFDHVAAEVPDLAATRTELESHGIGVRETDGWLEAPLTPPKYGTGVPFRLRGPGSLALCGDQAAEPVAPQEVDGPTLGIVGLDHVCQAFGDRDELARAYAELAGFVQVWRTPLDEHPDMADLVLNIPGSTICWEIIMPRGEDSFIDRFLARNGPAVHHVTFQVADWGAAMAACEYHETPTFDDEDGITDGARWRHTFIHPKHAGGVLVQLFWEERPGVWVRSDKIAPE